MEPCFYPELDKGLPITKYYEPEDTHKILLDRCNMLYFELSNRGYDLRRDPPGDESDTDELKMYLVTTGYKYNKQLREDVLDSAAKAIASVVLATNIK